MFQIVPNNKDEIYYLISSLIITCKHFILILEALEKTLGFKQRSYLGIWRVRPAQIRIMKFDFNFL